MHCSSARVQKAVIFMWTPIAIRFPTSKAYIIGSSRDGLAADPGSFMSLQLQQPMIARFDPFPPGTPVRFNLHLSVANNCSAAIRELGNSGRQD
jgi:hypothetical protein